jgi:membrane protein YdbS with pleckstrin-like domain
MGRESRQARRHRQRRNQQHHKSTTTSRWAIAGGSAVIVAVMVLFVALALRGASAGSSPSAGQTTASAAPTIHGLACNQTEQLTYHIHAHLEFYVDGKYSIPPPFIGINIYHDCLYWMHTHSPSLGVIHVEAPGPITPSLGDFFAVWHQPISRHRVWKYAVKPGQSMRVYVDGKVYSGDPSKIKVTRHENIAIEIGPPFAQPKPFSFAAHGIS